MNKIGNQAEVEVEREEEREKEENGKLEGKWIK